MAPTCLYKPDKGGKKKHTGHAHNCDCKRVTFVIFALYHLFCFKRDAMWIDAVGLIVEEEGELTASSFENCLFWSPLQRCGCTRSLHFKQKERQLHNPEWHAPQENPPESSLHQILFIKCLFNLFFHNTNDKKEKKTFESNNIRDQRSDFRLGNWNSSHDWNISMHIAYMPEVLQLKLPLSEFLVFLFL